VQASNYPRVSACPAGRTCSGPRQSDALQVGDGQLGLNSSKWLQRIWHGMGWEWPVCVKILLTQLCVGDAGSASLQALHGPANPFCIANVNLAYPPSHPFLRCLIVKNRAAKANHGVERQCHTINRSREPAGRRINQAVS